MTLTPHHRIALRAARARWGSRAWNSRTIKTASGRRVAWGPWLRWGWYFDVRHYAPEYRRPDVWVTHEPATAVKGTAQYGKRPNKRRASGAAR